MLDLIELLMTRGGEPGLNRALLPRLHDLASAMVSAFNEADDSDETAGIERVVYGEPRVYGA